MKSLVTGYGGFIGGHLVELLLAKGEELLCTFFRPTTEMSLHIPGSKVLECDIRNKNLVFSLLQDFKPHRIYHLAAQSYPTSSWDDPWYTIETNVIGTINIFEGLRNLSLNCMVLNACSSAQYGYVTEDEVPICESHSFKPLHPYGISKVAQEMLAYQYYKNFNIKTISVRIYNTTGPRKVNDVCSDLTRRIVEIEKGINPTNELRVGTLKTRRSIIDVRDTIRAFPLALDKATVGETYNLSGEKVYSIQEIVDILRNIVEVDFTVKQDPKLMRPTDEPIIYGDSAKFTQETGWKPEIPLRNTLLDMLDYWRKIL